MINELINHNLYVIMNSNIHCITQSGGTFHNEHPAALQPHPTNPASVADLLPWYGLNLTLNTAVMSSHAASLEAAL